MCHCETKHEISCFYNLVAVPVVYECLGNKIRLWRCGTKWIILADVPRQLSLHLVSSCDSCPSQRYTLCLLKRNYNIGNVGKTSSMGMFNFFESGNTFNNQPVKGLLNAKSKSLQSVNKNSTFFVQKKWNKQFLSVYFVSEMRCT